ncbi:MAG: MFS transporter [Thioalkalivibrionaceae bacterium]
MKARPASVVRRREVFGWAMFDFANQAYTLLIITVIFGDLFTRVIVGDGPDYRLGNLLWGLALGISYALVLIAAPLIGAWMDFSGARKRFLMISWLVTVVATAGLYFVEPGWVLFAMALVIVSNFGYALGESIIAAYLPDLGPPERLGWISGLGWALGYVGGLAATAVALSVLGETSADNYDRVRWVGPIAAAFFLLAAIPTFVFLRDFARRRRLSSSLGAALAWRRLRSTLAELNHRPQLMALMVSVFFVMAGIAIVVSFTFLYGAQVIGWSETTRVQMFVITQVTAIIGALAFGWLQDRIGPVRVYRGVLLLWVVTVIGVVATPVLAGLLEWVLAREVAAEQVFLLMGALAGLSLGSAQSAGRTLVGLLVQPQESGRWFGVWGLSAKAAAIFGLIGVGLLQWAVGLAYAILFCAVLFIAGFVAAGRIGRL